MSFLPRVSANHLVNNLLLSAKMALGAAGSTTTPEDRERLYQAVIAIENAMVERGKWQLECVHREDLKGIIKLLEKEIKRRSKRSAKQIPDGK